MATEDQTSSWHWPPLFGTRTFDELLLMSEGHDEAINVGSVIFCDSRIRVSLLSESDSPIDSRNTH